jgi:hypothetical protein
MERLSSAGRIFNKFDISQFFKNVSRKFDFNYNRTRIEVTLYKEKYTFSKISRSFIRRIKTVSHKICGKNQAHIIFVQHFFPKIVPFMR